MLWSKFVAALAVLPAVLAKPIAFRENVVRSSLERRTAGSASYTVASGDTGDTIAAVYSITFSTLSQANPNVQWTSLQIGQQINMPSARTPYSYTTAIRGDSQSDIAQKFNIYQSDLASANPSIDWARLQAGTNLRVPGYGRYTTYTVSSGDTGYEMASAFGISFSSLSAANPNVNWSNLQIGQVLTIPAGISPSQGSLPSPASSPAAATTTAAQTTPAAQPTTAAQTTPAGVSSVPVTIASTTSSPSAWKTATSSTTSSPSALETATSSTSSSSAAWLTASSTSKGSSAWLSATSSSKTGGNSLSTPSQSPTTTSAGGIRGSPPPASTSSTYSSLTTKSSMTTMRTSTTPSTTRTPTTPTTPTTPSTTRTPTTSSTARTSTTPTTAASMPTVTGANYVQRNDNAGSSTGNSAYTFYQGDGSAAEGWPAISSWVSFNTMWNNISPYLGQSCQSVYGVANNSPAENANVKSAIQSVAANAGVDERLVLSIIIQESSGCVRVKTTVSPDGTVTNPGLMQTYNGSGSCNKNGVIQNPCPASAITQMIMDGVIGTSQNGGQTYNTGLVQDINAGTGYSGAEVIYRATRIYNSGSVPSSGDLGAPGATRCYASDVANLLMGWTGSSKNTCTLDG